MKIRSIYISKFKNIPEKEICFDTDLTSLIIGQNGLGKSNLLEAITLIFVAISNKDSDLNLSNFDGKHFSFEIAYQLRGKEIKIIYGRNNIYQISIDEELHNFRVENSFNSTLVNKLNHDLIPDYFVTYYSGQNKRLEKILKKFEDDYFDGLKQNKDNSELTSRSKFLYLKNYHAPILLLTLSIFKDYKVEGKKKYEAQILNLFKHLNISGVDTFSLNVTSPYWIGNSFKPTLTEDEKLQKGYVTYIHTSKETPKKYPHPFWGLKSSLNNLLAVLTKSVDIIPYSNEDDITNNTSFLEFIDFNNVQIKDLQKYIFEHFTSPLELFYALEALGSLEIIDFENGLQFKIKKDESISLTYDLLSEGENQLLIVLGTVLITGVAETLFLFDEPDTYLNPKWQREYIQMLEDFNLEDEDSHLIVTTHSPLLVQNIEGENSYKYDLILLSKNENGEVEFDQDKGLFKNWRIDQVLASKYFDFISTRPKSIDKFMTKRVQIINSYANFDEAKAELEKFEDEKGYLPTGETITEIESLSFLKSLNNHD